MKIQYLGTGASEAIPATFCQCEVCNKARITGGREIRARSGIIIDGTLLIDFPPDIFHSSLRAGALINNVRDIVFTHSHNDHCDAAQIMYRAHSVYAKRTEEGNYTTHLYGNETVMKTINLPENLQTMDFTCINPFESFVVYGEIKVTPLLAEHAVNEKCYIFIVEKDGKRFLYGNDSGLFPDITMEYLQGIYIDCISLDCTGVMLKCEHGHMGFEADIKLKNMLIKQGTADNNTIFIAHHFSHNGFIPDGRYYSTEEFEQIAGGYGFRVSYDTMVVEI